MTSTRKRVRDLQVGDVLKGSGFLVTAEPFTAETKPGKVGVTGRYPGSYEQVRYWGANTLVVAAPAFEVVAFGEVTV